MKVTYVDHMGSDLSVVNAARVSFGKKSEFHHPCPQYKSTRPFADNCDRCTCWGGIQGGKRHEVLSERDAKLIQFLARGCTSGDWETLVDKVYASADWGMDWEDSEIFLKEVKNMPTHWTPFGHTAITLHIKAPIFVARQLGKHQVGMVWNEVSRRYVTDEPEFYRPDVWRKAADNVKQGSSEEAVSSDALYSCRGMYSEGITEHTEDAVTLYESMLENGICPEQARMVLPQSLLTEWYWTGNLYAFANVFIQRTDSHAQKEVQDVAHQIGEIVEPLFPVSWKALTK